MHWFILLIITIPAFQILLNNFYFTIHDDQHLVRLFLLDQGIHQGILFPRWVDGLGFGYGYPLYNFYPPLIYYLAEFFHLLGFSFIWSIKLMIITGFIIAALSIFLFLKQFVSKWAAILGTTIYTYFFYHAVLVYVRGAFAEFFSLAVLPFVFLGIYKIYKYRRFSSVVLFSFSFALLILTHPLVAFPSLLFIGFFFLFLLFFSQKKGQFITLFIIGLTFGLGLSSFFWLPSMVEKKYTLTDEILTKELANYKLHYIYPQQFWYSAWGYGGSTPGLNDGLTFQLGKIPIFLVVLSLSLSLFYFLKARRKNFSLFMFYFSFFLLLFSLFMSTSYSSFIWDNIRYLWYLQFPWRFLTFAAFFISIVGGYSIFFLEKFLPKKIVMFLAIITVFITIVKYQSYFRPQQLLITNDKERTSLQEIIWRISSTSYEFIPKGVKTKRTELGTTTLAVERKDLPKLSYEIISGKAKVKIKENKFNNKVFEIEAQTPIEFRLNTYRFPGWKAYLFPPSVILNHKNVILKQFRNLKIDDRNDLKLITVNIPKGSHQLEFKFEDTPIRKMGVGISAVSLFFIFFFLTIGNFQKLWRLP